MIIEEEKNVVDSKEEKEFMIDHISKEDRIIGLVWPSIRPGIEEMAAMHLLDGDPNTAYFKPFEIRLNLLTDPTTQLLVGFKVANKEKFMRGEITDRTYAGFCVFQYRAVGVHNYLTYIKPEYRGTNMLRLGHEFLLEMAKVIPAPVMTCCSDRKNMGATLEKLGYVEGLTEYRYKVK